MTHPPGHRPASARSIGSLPSPAIARTFVPGRARTARPARRSQRQPPTGPPPAPARCLEARPTPVPLGTRLDPTHQFPYHTMSSAWACRGGNGIIAVRTAASTDEPNDGTDILPTRVRPEEGDRAR